MTTASERRLATLLIFVAPVLWSVNYIVARMAVGQIAPHALALGRWGLAGLLLACFAWPEILAARTHIRPQWRSCLVLAALGMWICGAWVYIGGQTTVATHIALIYALSPVFVVLASVLWLGERVRTLQWLGIALALTGLVHVVLQGDWGRLARLQFVAGDLWIAACAISWAVYSILLKRWPSPFSAMARLVLICAGGMVILVPLALLEAWVAYRWSLPLYTTRLELKTLWIVLLAATLPGAGAFLVHSTITRFLGAAQAGLPLYLGPLVGAVMGWLVLGEPIEHHHLVGAAIIVPGIWLASRSR